MWSDCSDTDLIRQTMLVLTWNKKCATAEVLNMIGKRLIKVISIHRQMTVIVAGVVMSTA